MIKLKIKIRNINQKLIKKLINNIINTLDMKINNYINIIMLNLVKKKHKKLNNYGMKDLMIMNIQQGNLIDHLKKYINNGFNGVVNQNGRNKNKTN